MSDLFSVKLDDPHEVREVTIGEMRVLTAIITRITNGLDGKAETPIVKCRAFQLQAEGCPSTARFVTSMYCIQLLSTFIVYVYDYVIMCVRCNV